jgi:hypothetical protein
VDGRPQADDFSEVLARFAGQLPGDRRERLCVTLRVGAASSAAKASIIIAPS